MKTIKALLLLSLITGIGNAQVIFQKTFSRGIDFLDSGSGVKQTSDGGYILCGSGVYTTSGNYDAYIIKTNMYGDTLWTYFFGGPIDLDMAAEVTQTSDGGYIISGITYSFGAGSNDLYLLKLDMNTTVLLIRLIVSVLERPCERTKKTYNQTSLLC